MAERLLHNEPLPFMSLTVGRWSLAQTLLNRTGKEICIKAMPTQWQSSQKKKEWTETEKVICRLGKAFFLGLSLFSRALGFRDGLRQDRVDLQKTSLKLFQCPIHRIQGRGRGCLSTDSTAHAYWEKC